MELEEERLKAYQYYNNLIVTAENDMATKKQQLQIQEKMIHEDKEVTDQLLLELRRRTNVAASSSSTDIRNRATIILPDRASASAAPDPTSYKVYAIQGGTPTARKAEAARTKFGTQKNETRDLDFWYKMPLGYLVDQAQAHGWRLQGEYYIQRSGAKVKQLKMTKLDWRRKIFLLLNIQDPLDP